MFNLKAWFEDPTRSKILYSNDENRLIIIIQEIGKNIFKDYS